MASESDEADQRLFTPRTQFSGQIVHLAAGLAFYFALRSTVPAEPMLWWIGITVACHTVMLAIDLSFYWFRNASDAVLSVWRKIDQNASIANEVSAVATIFLLLPHANGEQMVFATAYFIGYIPCSILSDPGNVEPNRRAVLIVLPALAIWLSFFGQGAERVLAGLVLIYAAFLFVAMNAIARIVRDAVAARRGIEQANNALGKALAEVSAERDAKTRFMSAASHDLGQPLQAARLFGEQLAQVVPGAARHKVHGALMRSIESAQGMLSHMLHHMRLEADAVDPHLADVRIDEILQRLVDQYAAKAAAERIALRLVAPALTIRTDPVLLERAVGNLIDNALAHSAASRVLIGVRRRGQQVAIWVIDDGRGIASGDRATIFNDYVRGSDSVQAMRGGFGLGLASVRRLAQVLGASVWHEPGWPGGAAFCLALPGGERR